jgi:MYXO-CTERM domain-containing protein
VVFGAATLAVTSPARALAEFPGLVDEAYQLTCVPPCTLCHASPQGGGSADKPFALNVKAAVALLVGKTSETITLSDLEVNLPTALPMLAVAPCPNTSDKSCTTPMTCMGVCNGDGTGAGDVDELKANQNPNNSSTMPCVEYGCGSHVAPERRSRPLDGTAALFALGAALVLARRFRR